MISYHHNSVYKNVWNANVFGMRSLFHLKIISFICKNGKKSVCRMNANQYVAGAKLDGKKSQMAMA